MRRRVLGTITLLILSMSGSGRAEGAGPTYLHRLQLPVLRDAIGFAHSVTVDPHTHEIFVSDRRNNRILIFDGDGYFNYQILGGEEFGSPQDIAVDPDGLLLAIATRAGRRQVLELDFDGVFRREVPLIGMRDDLVAPRFSSLALSQDGSRIFLVDAANNRLWIVDRDGQIVRSADPFEDLEEGRRGDLTLGHVDVYGDTVLLASPSEGQIVILNDRGEVETMVGAQGTARCQLGRASAAALTSANELLVIDQQRMLLSQWAIDENRCLGEYIGIGSRPGYLYYPFDLALDENGRIYIGQSWDGRVQVFEGMGAAPGVGVVP